MQQDIRPLVKQTHPLGPIIIFSYGMTKCGSTLAFEYARTALELAGFPQPLIPEAVLERQARINFIGHVSPAQAQKLREFAWELGHPLVIKTHTRPDPAVIKMIDHGQALAQACYRDPREMALSMLDHGARARAEGRKAFSEINDLEAARRNILHQVDTLTQWLYRPGTLPLFYEDLAFSPLPTIARITRHLGLEIKPGSVLEHVRKYRFTQLNKGKPKRYKGEMTRAEQLPFCREFRPLLRRLIKNRSALEANSSPERKRAVLREGELLIRADL